MWPCRKCTSSACCGQVMAAELSYPRGRFRDESAFCFSFWVKLHCAVNDGGPEGTLKPGLEFKRVLWQRRVLCSVGYGFKKSWARLPRLELISEEPSAGPSRTGPCSIFPNQQLSVRLSLFLLAGYWIFCGNRFGRVIGLPVGQDSEMPVVTIRGISCAWMVASQGIASARASESLMI